MYICGHTVASVWLQLANLISYYTNEPVSITDIQGASFQSPLVGQTVHGVAGVVSAKDKYGFWLQGEPSEDVRISSGIRVYGRGVAGRVEIGDLVSLSGRVAEYRNVARPNDLFLTELEIPSRISVHSSGNIVTPLVLGRTGTRSPPLVRYSALDEGPNGWLSIPNNVTLLESKNASLQPQKYGLDFWESLEGMLVTIPTPTAANFPDRFGSMWVYGDWEVNGLNERGGLTLTIIDEGQIPDAHPETILIGHPVDGTRNPKVSVGTKLSNITGVVTYQFGFYTILPLTAPAVISSPEYSVPPASISRGTDPCELTIGDYNVENMSPSSHHIPLVASHIVNHLHTPDIVFLQEIVSDSGSKNNGVVTANKTLGALVKAINKAALDASNGLDDIKYEFVNIAPENNVDGGKPGSNIRVAYLWRPEKVSLAAGHVAGNATQPVAVVKDTDGFTVRPNPGRINPLSSAWEESRKPMAAAWQTTTGERFFTVNVHLSSKRGGSSNHGDARPPVNGHNERRMDQVNETAAFVESILYKDVNASIIVAGDMNEYIQTQQVFQSLSELLSDINVISGVPPEERYTYVYEQNMQEIDHIFISDAIARRGTEVEHVHVNTWAPSVGERASDHDPTVAKVWVCEPSGLKASEGTDTPTLVIQDS